MAEPCYRTVPGFLDIPAELRLIVYSLLLNPGGSKTLSIRTEDPASFEASEAARPRRRSNFRIMSDRFRARSMLTSYHLTSKADICVSILGVNRRVHDEAARFLYSAHAFDFDTDIECIIPCSQDLTPFALASIGRVNIVKRALPYVKEFGRTHMFQAEDFRTISNLDGMEWVNEVAAITGLRVLDIKAHLTHCPIASSDAMAFFIRFSSSIETGFAEYLRAQMAVIAA